MSSTMRRATIYFEPEVHRQLRRRAEESERSLSALVNDAVRLSLEEDAEDLAAFDSRASEPDLLFEDVVVDLKRRGKL